MRLLAAATLVLAAACTSTTPAAQSPGQMPTTPPLDTTKYVALGDSFTAGPLVPTTDVAGGCFRSDHNYPALLAERLDVEEFVDVSCSGADTRDLTGRQGTFTGAVLPPQIHVVDEETTLVSVGIGGNDFGLYRSLVSTCLRLRDRDPEGAPCREALGSDVRRQTERIADRVVEVLDLIQDRAPDARVVVVGYPRIAPPEGSCPGRLPYATGDVPFGDRALRLLNEATAYAAERAGSEFVDLYAASRGHDVCSDEPWVNGVGMDQRRAAAFHPFLRGMRGTAAAIEAHLTG
jgi:lysophospholipase L1-like esterase